MKQANIPEYNVDKVIDGTIHINIHDSPTLIMTEEERTEHVLGIIMIQQFSLKAGLKEFGTKGEEAVTKELKQHFYKCYNINISPIANPDIQYRTLGLLCTLWSFLWSVR